MGKKKSKIAQSLEKPPSDPPEHFREMDRERQENARGTAEFKKDKQLLRPCGWTLIKLLNKGGFGDVYLGEYNENAYVAIAKRDYPRVETKEELEKIMNDLPDNLTREAFKRSLEHSSSLHSSSRKVSADGKAEYLPLEGMKFAVKTMPLVLTKKFREQRMAELEAFSLLRHPNIVEYHYILDYAQMDAKKVNIEGVVFTQDETGHSVIIGRKSEILERVGLVRATFQEINKIFILMG
jgi:serine/threonine protein kinase